MSIRFGGRIGTDQPSEPPDGLPGYEDAEAEAWGTVAKFLCPGPQDEPEGCGECQWILKNVDNEFPYTFTFVCYNCNHQIEVIGGEIQ